MAIYIYQRGGWPEYEYDLRSLISPLSDVLTKRGALFGSLQALGFDDLQDAKLEALSLEVIKSSEIEGEVLDAATVKSSIARRLGMSQGGVPSGDHQAEGAVAVSLDATEYYTVPLDEERLFRWHASLFPSGISEFGRIKVGQWREDLFGPMQVVSMAMTPREKVHFEAPPATDVQKEMDRFLDWFEHGNEVSDVIKAGVAHLWFVTIHPFSDGNGRIGRAIMDLMLARADKRRYRCYSVSSQIRRELSEYYNALESAQRGKGDYTEWLNWYLGCLSRALDESARMVAGALERTRFWNIHAKDELNDRQVQMLRRMLVGWEGKMTNKKWQQMAKCSDATASRDLEELARKGIFAREGEGRGVRYRFVHDRQPDATD